MELVSPTSAGVRMNGGVLPSSDAHRSRCRSSGFVLEEYIAEIQSATRELAATSRKVGSLQEA